MAMNWRIKPLDAILATAEKKSLHRSLEALQLTLFGIGCIIGTGIFVLTAAGAQKAGPGLMLAFLIAGAICVVAALCYAEIASMIPVSGSAYTYTYSVMGELLAWTVGWALVLEYAVAASAVSVGWSGYFSGTILNEFLGIVLPAWLAGGPLSLGGIEGGFINLPAVVIALLVTWLLMIGTSESARVNAVLVAIKVSALRRAEPTRPRRFRTPALWLVGPTTMAGTLFLFLNLPKEAMLVLPVWAAIGLLLYVFYGYRKSHLGKGRIEVHEPEIAGIEPGVPGLTPSD